jgi:hypothetical protein
VPPEKIEDLEATANSPDRTGLEARHGREQGIPKAHDIGRSSRNVPWLFPGWIQELKAHRNSGNTKSRHVALNRRWLLFRHANSRIFKRWPKTLTINTNEATA